MKLRGKVYIAQERAKHETERAKHERELGARES